MWQAIPMIIGAAMSARAAENKKSQQERYNKAQAETTRYSPWTKMMGQLDNSYTPGAMEAGFGGAVQGLGMAQSMGSAFGGSSSAAPQASPQGASYLGGNQMAAQLGQPQSNDVWSSFGQSGQQQQQPNFFSSSYNFAKR
jgi:hypothetical protein